MPEDKPCSPHELKSPKLLLSPIHASKKASEKSSGISDSIENDKTMSGLVITDYYLYILKKSFTFRYQGRAYTLLNHRSNKRYGIYAKIPNEIKLKFKCS